jgi:hypothetical protein
MRAHEEAAKTLEFRAGGVSAKLEEKCEGNFCPVTIPERH